MALGCITKVAQGGQKLNPDAKAHAPSGTAGVHLALERVLPRQDVTVGVSGVVPVAKVVVSVLLPVLLPVLLLVLLSVLLLVLLSVLPWV